MMQKIKLWDLPTRACHWLLAVTVVTLLVTGELGGNAMAYHGVAGILALGLVVFRLVWGFAGSTYARFGHFFPTPARINAYFKGQWRGLGHNPLGALSVFALLAVLGAQAVLGLFATDDIAFYGPLYELVGRDLSERLTGLHQQLSTALILLVGLHVGAILFHLHVKKDNLVKPMLSGWKEAAHGEPARGGGLVPLVVALTVAGLAMWGASGIWLPEPPPPPAAETPAW